MLADLDWLPPPPADFRPRCRALGDGRAVQQLATHRLDGDELHRLGTAIGRLRDAGANLAPLVPLRLGVLAEGTMDLVVAPLVASAARHGVLLTVTLAPFGQAFQSAVDPASPLHQARPDAILVALDHRSLAPSALGEAASAAALTAASARLDAMLDGIRAAGDALPILATVAPPAEAWLGSVERALPGSPAQLIAAFNDQLAARAAAAGRALFDVAALAATVGLGRWHDAAQWHLGKLPFAQQLIPLYAEALARLLGAVRGRSRKCLVLDLDHTLWGGAVGDDGVEGLVVGQGDPAGEAYLAVQRAALGLRERGILLAVCSKNDDAVARLPFRRHPELLLREEHFSAFVANWRDKSENLAAIARQLGLGLDALVLLDDNPAERAEVRARLPEVAVPELPSDPAGFPRALAAAGYFEAVRFGADDRQRAARYADDVQRETARAAAGSTDDYLRSLEMRALVGPIDALGRARVTQLINKTNQFNLTTRRYTEPEVARLARDAHTWQVRLVDRFGDNGLVAALICVGDGADWRIDTWLMSCRVLGRQLERALLNHVALAAQRRGVGALVGEYLPTARNGIVRDLYPSLGFVADGERWRLALGAFVAAAVPVEVVASDGA